MPHSAALHCKILLAWLLGLVLVACGTKGDAVDHADRPHIVLVIADDLGFGDLERFGGPERTPTLANLAERGITLEQFHTFPLCTPSRAALMTGRSPLRDGLAWSPLRPWSELGLARDVETLPEALQNAGYRTALLGKWHLGHARADQHPQQHGFDHFYGFLTGAIDYFSHESRDGGHDWQRNGDTAQETGYVTRLLTREAVGLINEHDFAQPLFLMLSYSAPHRPMQAPQETLAEMNAFTDPAERVYAAMLTEFDRGLARVQTALAEKGVSHNTLWVFLSDNGAALQLGGSNGVLKGGKSAVMQGGLRVPAIVYWPSRIEGGGVHTAFQTIQDIAPTLAQFAGAPFHEQIDGRDLSAYWLGNETEALRSLPIAFVAHNDQRGQMALIDWPWKYIRRIDRKDASLREQLFHIGDDPTESINLIRKESERVGRMREELKRWIALDPQQLSLDRLPEWKGDAPETWKAPATWAEAVR